MALSVKNNIDPYDFTCYWRVENFKASDNLSILSPSFEIKELKTKWYLEIAEEDGFLGVFLFKATEPKYCLTKFYISLLISTEWILILENPNYRYRGGGCGYGMPKVMSLEKLKENPWIHLPNGSLTVSFSVRRKELESVKSQCLIVSRMVDQNELLHRTVELFSNLKPSDLLSFEPTYNFTSREMTLNRSNQKAKEVQTQHTQTEKSADLKDGSELLKLLKEDEYSFVTLRTPNKEFVIHKSILCAQSQVFPTMFECQMKESECSSVDIDDIDGQTMASLIQFLHFKPLRDLNWDAAATLYYAANKYQIDSLKKECVLHLKKELSVENVCDAFLLADLHQEKELQSCAQEYFGKNLKLIFTSKHWKDFLCHTELVAEILHELGKNM